MINFSTLKWLTIPDGKVKQIIDGNGTVLWRIKLSSIAVTTPPTKTQYQEGEVFDPTGMVVTATYSNGETKVISNYTVLNGNQISKDAPTVTISYTENGVTATTAYEVGFAPDTAIVTLPNGVSTSFASSNKTRYLTVSGVGISGNPSEVPIGTILTCTISGGDEDSAYIVLNGTIVASGYINDRGKSVTYDYTVTGNANITLTQEGYGYYIRITEIPEGHALVTIAPNATYSGPVYVTIDGVDYHEAATLAVPIGTVIACHAPINDNDKLGYVTVNGVKVAENGNGYNYTVIGNVSILLTPNKGGGYITITET